MMKSDRDNDMTINEKEGKMLALRIRMSLEAYDVVFDSDKFLEAIGGDTTVQAIIDIVQKLMPSDKEEDDESEEE